MTRAVHMTRSELLDLGKRTSQLPSIQAMRDNPVERKARTQKYGNVRVVDKGISFDSKAEHHRWQYLVMLERAGKIKDLKLQVPFELIPAQVAPDGKKIRPTIYLADFCYTDSTGSFVCEDVKGAATDVWKIKQKLMLRVHNIWVKEVRS